MTSIGGPLGYLMVVTNRGPGLATNVIITDVLPAGVAFVSATSTVGSCTHVDGVVTCTLGDLNEGGTVEIEIEGMLTNISSSLVYSIDAQSSENTIFLRTIDSDTGSTLTSTLVTMGANAINGANALAIDPTTCTIWAVLRVNGNPLRDLVTIDPATGQATLIGNTGDFFSSIAFDNAGTLYGATGTGGSPSPHALYTLDKTDASSSFLMSLSATDGGEAIAFNADNGLLYRATGFDLQTFQSIHPTTLEVHNIATTGGLSSRAPTGMTYTDAGSFLLSTVVNLYNVTTGGVSTLINFLDHDGKTISARSGRNCVCNEALASVDALDPNPTNNAASACAVITAADLALQKSGWPRQVVVGSNITYTLSLTNLGPGQATTVRISDPLDHNLLLLAATSTVGACSLNAGTVQCDMGSVPGLAGATVTLTLQATNAPLDLMSISGTNPALHIISPLDGAELGTFGIMLAGETVERGTGLATDPTTGDLYATLRLTGQSGAELVVLNPTSGVAVSVGDTGDDFVDIAFDGTGTLFGVTGESALTPQTLFILNKSDATPSFFLTPTQRPFGNDGIGFNPVDGLLYHISGGFFDTQRMEKVNLDTMAITAVPINPAGDNFIQADALTFYRPGLFLLSAQGVLLTMTPGGTATYVDDMMGHFSAGLAFAPRHIPNRAEVTATELDQDPFDNVDGILTRVFLDKDGDGLGDAWEHKFLGHTNAVGGTDSDGDALINLDEFGYDTGPANPDTDADAMPDGWEVQHDFDPRDDGAVDPLGGPDGDADGDLFRNQEEYVADTAPRDGDSFLQMTGIGRASPPFIKWLSSSSRLYTVHFSPEPTDGGSWSNLAPTVQGSGSVMTHVDVDADADDRPVRAYRVGVQIP